jgi:phosphate transport system protein
MQQEIERLKKKILGQAAVVEEVVGRAVNALHERDEAAARAIIDGDERIDRMEVEVEEDCLKILALYQPVATDLRFVITVLKINNDIERVGDLASNIARRALFLCARPPLEVPFDFDDMRTKSLAMLRDSLDSLMRLDADKARAVRAQDDVVDAAKREMQAWFIQAMQRTPADIEPLLSYLGISRHLERLADYATNIAEDVIYLVEGEIVRHTPEGPTSG